MAINKVVYNNETLIDISGDTVSPATLAYGVTAHDASGKSITGTADMSGSATIPTKVSDLENDLDFIQNDTTDDVTFGGNVAVPAGGLLKVVNINVPWSVSSGDSAKTTNVSASTVQSGIGSGWTALGVVGWNSGNGQWYVRACYLNNGGITFATTRRDSTSSGADSFNGSVHVLCVRTSL